MKLIILSTNKYLGLNYIYYINAILKKKKLVFLKPETYEYNLIILSYIVVAEKKYLIEYLKLLINGIIIIIKIKINYIKINNHEL